LIYLKYNHGKHQSAVLWNPFVRAAMSGLTLLLM